MKIRLFFFALIALFISSCARNNGSIESKTSNKEAALSLAVASASNNPYDSTGIWHNRLLDSVKGYILKGGSNTREGRVAYLADLAKRNFSLDLSAVLRNNLSGVATDPAAIDSRFVDGLDYTASGKRYILQLIAILKVADNKTALTTEARIADFENKIMADPGLPSKDKKALLQASSVARYSNRYWSDFSNSDQVPVTKFKFFKDVWSSVAYIGALVGDVVAAVKGAAGGEKDAVEVAVEAANTSVEVGDEIGDWPCLGDC